jgi:hypothetical protein
MVLIAIIARDHQDRPYNAMISMRIMESAVEPRIHGGCFAVGCAIARGL